jgi:hypothetical protein
MSKFTSAVLIATFCASLTPAAFAGTSVKASQSSASLNWVWHQLMNRFGGRWG